jgi:hypothetical protein
MTIRWQCRHTFPSQSWAKCGNEQKLSGRSVEDFGWDDGDACLVFLSWFAGPGFLFLAEPKADSMFRDVAVSRWMFGVDDEG